MRIKETVIEDDPNTRLFGDLAVTIEPDAGACEDPREHTPLHYITNIGRFLRLYESPDGGAQALITAVGDAEREGDREFAIGEAPVDEFSARDLNERGLSYPNDRYLEAAKITRDLDFGELIDAAREAGFWIRPIYYGTHGPICDYSVGPTDECWEEKYGYDGIVWISPKEMAEQKITSEYALSMARSALHDLTCIANGDVFYVGTAPAEIDEDGTLLVNEWTWEGPFFGHASAEEFVQEEYGEKEGPSPS